ncbi:MAG: DUF6240 domain-containing protein [Turicibacter sp.]|nr:DUF6240 domain-containing protein [Turicibacter sp.]
MNGFLFIPNIKNNGLLSVFNRQGGGNTPTFNNGDTLSATMTAREGDTATLRTADDFIFNVAANTVQGNVGDVLHFKIISQDKSGLALRQIFPHGVEAAIKRGNAGIDDVQNAATSLERMNEEAEYRASVQKEEQAKVAQAISQIKRGQQSIANNATRAAISAIAASGLDLHKISFFSLNNIIQEIKNLPDIPKINDNFYDTPILETPTRNAGDDIYTAYESLEKVQGLLEGGLSDAAIASLLQSNKEITPETVYSNRYKGGRPQNDYLANWDSLEEQITRRFDRLGIQSNESNIDAAKFLIANNLPINRENVESTILLRNLQLIPQEMLFEEVKTAILSGENPTDIKLMPLLSSLDMAEVLETVKSLPKLQPQDVRAVMEAGKTLNLEQIREAAELREIQQTMPTTPTASPENIENLRIEIPPEKLDSLELIKAQRQLAEIQWKMTVQAAVRLADKGISINTAHLQELVMQLRALERENNAGYLRAVGADDSRQNTLRMEDIFRTIQEIRPVAFHLNANISGKIMTNQVKFDLAGIHQAAKAYEAMATTPSGRYGDSFAKIADQFEGFLKNINIDPTAENIRAASILSRNNIDIALSTIEAIKAIDAKIAAVMDRLSPMMAAQMLKEGFTPLDMHMDEMLDYIRKFEQQHGYSGKDKIAQHIFEMDQSKILSEEERSGMIAIYRMLNLIHKNGSAALGMAMKQGVPLTLGNLMEAAKYYDGKKLDVSADDNIKNALTQPTSIRSMLAQAHQAALSYTDLLADAVIDKAAPKTLKKWGDANQQQRPLEDLLQEAPKPPPFEPNQQLQVQALKQFTEAPPALIALLQQVGILPSPDNIKAARKLREENSLTSLQQVFEELKDTAILDNMTSQNLANLLENGEPPKPLTKTLWDALENAPPTQAVRDAQHILAAKYHEQESAQFNDLIDTPFLLNDRFANLKMYTLNESAVAAGTAKTFLTLLTTNLGNVQTTFTQQNSAVTLHFTVESPAVRIKLQTHLPLLQTLLQEQGFTLEQPTFTYATDSQLPQGKQADIDPEELEDSTLLQNFSEYEFVV